MPRLSELLLREAGTLAAYAEYVQNRLYEEYLSMTKQHPLYAIKWRIKTFDSIRGKLERIAEEQSEESPQAMRLLHDGDIQLPDLLGVVHDVIGVRVVWLFEESKKIAFRRIIETFKWLEIDRKWIKVFARSFGIPASLPLTRYQVASDASGYSSDHLTAAVKQSHDPSGRYRPLRFELQCRTIFEEAWSEVSHHVQYKGLTKDDLKQSVRTIKRHLDACDEVSQSAFERLRKIRNYPFFPLVQVVKHYPLLSKEARIGQRLLDMHERAHTFRREGKFAESEEVLAAALNDIKKLVPPDYLDRVERRLRCDLAISRLYLETPPSVAKARQDLEAVKKSRKDSFWLTLRMAEMHRREGEYRKSVDSCKRAIERIKNIELSTTDGLEADILRYMSSLQWKRARDVYVGGLFAPDSGAVARSKMADYNRAKAWHAEAISHAISSINKWKALPSDEVIVTEAQTALLYYVTQYGLDDTDLDTLCVLDGHGIGRACVESVAHAVLRREQKSPRVFETISWACAHGLRLRHDAAEADIGGRLHSEPLEQARELKHLAIALTAAQSTSAWRGRYDRSLSRHAELIDSALQRRPRKLVQPLQEYWGAGKT